MWRARPNDTSIPNPCSLSPIPIEPSNHQLPRPSRTTNSNHKPQPSTIMSIPRDRGPQILEHVAASGITLIEWETNEASQRGNKADIQLTFPHRADFSSSPTIKSPKSKRPSRSWASLPPARTFCPPNTHAKGWARRFATTLPDPATLRRVAGRDSGSLSCPCPTRGSGWTRSFRFLKPTNFGPRSLRLP